LQEFDLPATLYLTTYYTDYQRPVFDLMCSYLLWLGRTETLNFKELTGQDGKTELHSNAAREAALSELQTFVRARQLSAAAKDEFAAKLSAHLDVDYARLLEQRVMHNLSPAEVKQLADDGVDIQLHTHRHRTPKDRELFLREIDDNRSRIHEMTGRATTHFCYPSGRYAAAFLPWLQVAGVVSATTCESGFASPNSNPLLLPRFLDNENLSDIEFESWLKGVSLTRPRRRPALSAPAGGLS
jgi:hypothetical protein